MTITGPDASLNLCGVLVQPPPAADAAKDLVEELESIGAGWLVTRRESALDEAAKAAPESLKPRGRICTDGNLWEVTGVSHLAG